jgi:hypothetical protein
VRKHSKERNGATTLRTPHAIVKIEDARSESDERNKRKPRKGTCSETCSREPNEAQQHQKEYWEDATVQVVAIGHDG